jgi:3-oxoacyl-[acyl-carrier protein] reductase
MADLLLRLANDPRTSGLIRMLGLPAPVILARETGGYRARPLEGHTLLHGSLRPGGAHVWMQQALLAAGASLRDPASTSGAPALASVVGGVERFNGAVLDATGLTGPDDYRPLYDFFHPILPSLKRNARVVIVGDLPEALPDPLAAAAARGLEGFTRSLAKEVGKRGATANLLYLAPGAADRVGAPLVFFCSARSTYVDGQAVRVSALAALPAGTPGEAVLQDRIALVTGAARGIGAATAGRLAEEGAHVLCLDVAADRDGLYDTAARVGGTPFVADVADPATPARLADFVRQKFGGFDLLIHNAGITRDKTLAKMPPAFWDSVVAVNFRAITAIDAEMCGRGLLRAGGRIVCLSSMGGLAGNFGQTHYAATKAALIAYVAALAPRLAAQGITVNAVAPGFIETRMTAGMPLLPREIGRRLNSLAQGGQPRDVAELITFLATPGACGISGATIRVCGQAWFGA